MSDLRAVRKHSAQHDLFNRIHSIASDEAFVRRVAQQWYDNRFEVVANQRCGNWYCDPSTSSKTYAYFKSTDGHTSNWDFNLRRSNLPLASYAEKQGGLILVDSTRRGKRMPDGLSKTVPIWCSAINLAISLRKQRLGEGENSESWDTSIYLPPQIVSPSEKAQIESRLLKWATNLETSVLPLPSLSKPLRPFFIHPSTSGPPFIPESPEYIPIICLSASRWVNSGDEDGVQDDIPLFTRFPASPRDEDTDTRTVGFEYVPGAGDDDELWGRGLTPEVFHQNKSRLLSTSREELPEAVDELVKFSQLPSRLTEDLEKLQVDPRSSSIGPSAQSVTKANDTAGVVRLLNPVQISTSPSLIVDMGPCVSVNSSNKPSFPSTILPSIVFIRIVQVDKPPTDEIGYIITLPVQKPSDQRQAILLLPDAKSHGREYMRSLQSLLNYLHQNFTLRRESNSETALQSNIFLFPGRQDHSPPSDTSGPVPSQISTLNLVSDVSSFTTTELQNARKGIIPLLLVILCTYRSLLTSSEKSGENDLDTPVTKAIIANHLHTLVALWPDSNPSRAALKRVNEFLMGEVKRV